MDHVYAVGPVPMMGAVSEATRPYGVPTTVSLNTIMVDGTGMCGGCRVSVAGKTVYACVDGPEFDGHTVDFKQLADRLAMYREVEREILRRQSLPHRRTGRGRRGGHASMTTERPDLSPRERMRIERHEVPARSAVIRAMDFREVNLGYSQVLAMEEAERCLDCQNPRCIDGCPVRVNIPKFIELLAGGDLKGAAESLLDDNALPCVTGRVCPQETQCEGLCIRGKKGEPVAVGALERFVADWALEHLDELEGRHDPDTGRRVAIVGSGPAGLTAAGELAKSGHSVTVFEAFHAPGGVLIYGIPEFRLPKDIVQKEVDRLKELGVKIEVNAIVGKTWTLRELRQDFDAVFIAVGAGLPVFMGIPGEDLKGVYSANEYLTRVNLMGAFRKDTDTPVLQGQRVVVVGGGNVAMDAVRTALRMGATEAIVAYRRGKDELPARREEVHHAEEEGVEFELMASPVEVIGNETGLGGRPALPDDGAGRAGRLRAPPPASHPRLGVTSSTATWSWWPSARAATRCSPPASRTCDQRVGLSRRRRDRHDQRARHLRRRRHRARRGHGHPGHGRRQARRAGHRALPRRPSRSCCPRPGGSRARIPRAFSRRRAQADDGR